MKIQIKKMAASRQGGGGVETTKLDLSTEWLELESDPGLFTLLVEDFGVDGIRVQEVYDVTQSFQDRVIGFVFLFQWVEERRSRKKALFNDECFVTEATVLRNMFFAHQIVVNSCATHALLSILLNCQEAHEISLGPTLEGLKLFCKDLDPESRGYAIGNTPELASAHNSHAKPEIQSAATPSSSKRGAVVTSAAAYLPETYHFVSYVPVGDRLFELDGLKEWPIDHGPWAEAESWTDLFKRIIIKRLNEGEGSITFNLMAVIADPIPRLSQQLKQLQITQTDQLDEIYRLAKEIVESQKDSRQVGVAGGQVGGAGANGEWPLDEKALNDEVAKLIEAASCTIEPTRGVLTNGSISSQDYANLEMAIVKMRHTTASVDAAKNELSEEMETRKKFKIDAQRRTHDYDKFFVEYFKSLANNGLLPQRLLEQKRGKKRGTKPGTTSKNKKPVNHARSKSFSNGPL